MSKFNKFMKQNKVEKKTVAYKATKSLLDEDGEPLLWTLKPITSKMNDEIREDCTTEVQIKGKANMYRQKVNSTKYVSRMICKTVVEPDLYDKELQDSYGVMTPEELLQAMVDDPGEYNDLATQVQEVNGFTSMEELVDTAKN